MARMQIEEAKTLKELVVSAQRLSILAVLLVCLPMVAWAGTVVVPLEQPIGELAEHVLPAAKPKIDLPGQVLILPYFEVNKQDPSAETTLFSIRNVSPTTGVSGNIVYYDVGGNMQVFSPFMLDPSETTSVNINDVGFLAQDPDGVARGYVEISTEFSIRAPADESDKGGVIGPPPQLPALVGDYFQVIQNQDFANGDRLMTLDPGSAFGFCQFFEARFLNGGAFSGGTDFVFVFTNPQGDNAGTDPPSMVASVVDEAGAIVSSVNIYTSDTVVKLPASAFTGTAFGTLEVGFVDGVGAMIATYSALGRFSVGMNGACRDRFAGDF